MGNWDYNPTWLVRTTPTQLLICSSFTRENGHPERSCKLITISTAQLLISTYCDYIYNIGGPPCSWWFHAHLSIRQRSCFPKVFLGKSLQRSLKPAPIFMLKRQTSVELSLSWVDQIVSKHSMYIYIWWIYHLKNQPGSQATWRSNSEPCKKKRVKPPRVVGGSLDPTFTNQKGSTNILT